MDVLTSRIGKRHQNLQFDVCCKAIDQNFNCGCVLKKGDANLQLLGNPNKKNYNTESLITGLKSSLEQLKNMHIAWILPHDMAFQSQMLLI